MFKFAISNPRLLRLAYSCGHLGRFVSFRLPAIDKIRDEKLLDEIYSRVTTPGGHGKQSSRQRFVDVDKVSAQVLTHMSRRIVHDIAVSSGITSCELFDAISSLENLEFYISDKYNHLQCEGRVLQRIYSHSGEMLCGYLGPLAAEEKPSRLLPGTLALYRVLRWLPRYGAHREINLFHPTTKTYLSDGRLKEIDYDVFASQIIGRFNFVRCMNILNLNSWFSDFQIRNGLANVVRSIADDGVLLLGRTRPDGTNDVTFYAKTTAGLKTIERINSGSELQRMVNDLSSSGGPCRTTSANRPNASES